MFFVPAYADIAEQLDVQGAQVYEQIAEKYGETVEKINKGFHAGLLTGSRADAWVPDGTPPGAIPPLLRQWWTPVRYR